MSPNAWIEIDDDGALIATDGETQLKKWTYSDFEEYVGECITPSMYQFMVEYVYDNIDKDTLRELECDDYDGRFDEQAVEAYFELPWQERLKLHQQTQANLEAEHRRFTEKIHACDEMPPFDPSSPIYVECCQFLADLKAKTRAKLERLEREIHEEGCWRGGWEEGESDTENQLYDPMDEQ